MNEYTARFIAPCPTNGMLVNYEIVIATDEMILVETLQKRLGLLAQSPAYHEDIAGLLHETYGGRQTHDRRPPRCPHQDRPGRVSLSSRATYFVIT